MTGWVIFIEMRDPASLSKGWRDKLDKHFLAHEFRPVGTTTLYTTKEKNNTLVIIQQCITSLGSKDLSKLIKSMYVFSCAYINDFTHVLR